MNKTADNQDIKLISYPVLNQFDEILNFTTTRTGGVSAGSYGTLNLSSNSGDDLKKVITNREILLEKTKIAKDRMILPFQTHSYSVLLIDEDFLASDLLRQNEKLNGVDALITNIPGVCIAVSTADCVPVLLYDPVNKAIASVHAGWKGTCTRIATHTVNLMKEAFGTNPKDLVATIGPSISPDVYEVGAELIDAFVHAGFDVKKIFAQRKGKIYLNLWRANKDILLDNGVDESNIEVSGLCTYSEPDMFFSARRSGINSGRMLTGIMLREH